MGMIDRYKKAGGFLQLLNLIETCGPQKQEKFLAIIKEEDVLWEATIRQKMLSMTKVMSWDSAVIAEITSRLQPLTLACALHGMTPEQNAVILNSLPFSQRRGIESQKESLTPSPAEISSAYMKILTDVREMATAGVLKFDKIDPDLYVESDIEEKISNQRATNAKKVSTVESHEVSVAAVNGDAEELKKKIVHLNQENNALKRELKTLHDKLEQIRKIA